MNARTAYGPPAAEAGFTLIELLVSLAIFALISLAGVGLIETVAGVKQRTEVRAERLAEIQRALFLVTADLEQLAAGPLPAAGGLGFTRGSARGDYPVAYTFAGGALHRIANGQDMAILSGIAGGQVRFLKHGAWTAIPFTENDKSRPQALELTFALAPQPGAPSGIVRRIVELPAGPLIPPDAAGAAGGAAGGTTVSLMPGGTR